MIIFTISLMVIFITAGFICPIIFAGLKGGGQNTVHAYGCGFGAHHPGGIFFSHDAHNKTDSKHYILPY